MTIPTSRRTGCSSSPKRDINHIGLENLDPFHRSLGRRRSASEKNTPEKPIYSPPDRWASPDDDNSCPLRRSYNSADSSSAEAIVIWVDTAIDWSKREIVPPEQRMKLTPDARATLHEGMHQEAVLGAIRSAFQSTSPSDAFRKSAVAVLDRLWESVGAVWQTQDDGVAGAFGRLRRQQAEDEELCVEELLEMAKTGAWCQLLPDCVGIEGICLGQSPVPFNSGDSPNNRMLFSGPSPVPFGMEESPAPAHRKKNVRSPVTPCMLAGLIEDQFGCVACGTKELI